VRYPSALHILCAGQAPKLDLLAILTPVVICAQHQQLQNRGAAGCWCDIYGCRNTDRDQHVDSGCRTSGRRRGTLPPGRCCALRTSRAKPTAATAASSRCSSATGWDWASPLTLLRCVFTVCSAAVLSSAVQRCLPEVYCHHVCAACYMLHIALCKVQLLVMGYARCKTHLKQVEPPDEHCSVSHQGI
jgi:hypothetical protein